MPISEDIVFVDPADVLVERSSRQRKEIKVEDLKDSIQRLGILHPIIVTDEMLLIAGERRLTACLELGIKVPVRKFSSLSDIERKIIELEENFKREDLDWRDRIQAVGLIHEGHKSRAESWTQGDTARSIGMDDTTISKMLYVYENLDSPIIADIESWRVAYNRLMAKNNRIVNNVLADLLENANTAFSAPEVRETPATVDSILNDDFVKWAPHYKGPKFNLIHCDFPYGIDAFLGAQMQQDGNYADTFDTYKSLIATLHQNLDNLLAPSGHILFWFSMKYYTYTRKVLQDMNLTVNPIPLVWHKSDNTGVCPDAARAPRQVYETAFLAYRGDRPIVKVVGNCHSSPTDKSLHPSAKPEAMLKHFFSMLVDGSTRMLDPTAGSGSSLRAAEALGAEFCLGLELDLEHCANANAALRKARVIRAASKAK